MNPVLRRILFNRSTWLAFLLIFVVLSFSNGMSSGIRGGITWLLSVSAVAGSLTGYVLANTRIKAWLALSLLVLLGLTGMTFYITHLIEPFVQLINALIGIRDQLINWIGFQAAPPDLTVIIPPLIDIQDRTSALFIRVWSWWSGLRKGAIMSDPVARAFTWSISVYGLTAWAGWVLGRHRNPLIAFAPMIAVLAVVVDYTGNGFNPLWLMLGATLVLMGLSRYDQNRVRWKRSGVDFSESIPVDTGSAIIALTVALAAIAWITPSISVKAMAEAIRDWGNNQDKLAESFGLDPAPPPPSNFAPYISPKGLPRSHLVGSGPELSRQFVMTIRTGELPPRPQVSNPPPAPRHYWRSIIYDRYTGSGWLSSPVEVNFYETGEPLFDTLPDGYQPISQEVKFFKDTGGQLSWTGYLTSVNQPTEVAWRSRPSNLIRDDPFGGMDYLGAISPVDTYIASSLEIDIREETLHHSSASYPPSMEKFTSLPDSVPERVLSLARDITATETTPYDRALAIESYLRENYPYTLDVPAPPQGRDVADYFLFDLKKGYCDYYATAMVVLARAAGLPARFVSGYASGSYDSANAEYIVTEADAHSWAEIFFTDIGWVEFEPTAGLPSINRLDQPTYQSILEKDTEETIESTEARITQYLIRLIQIGGMAILLSSLFYFASLWIESGWLYLQPASISLSYVYRKMEKQGGLLAGGVSGETPFEFAARLTANIKELASRRSHLLEHRRSGDLIGLITNRYVQSAYSTHLILRNRSGEVIKAWRRLRFSLLLAKVLQLTDGRKKTKDQTYFQPYNI